MKVIDRRVLVLNKLWTVVNVCTLDRAISLVYAEKARIVDPFEQFAIYTWDDWSKLRLKDGEDILHSQRAAFRIPEVILLSDYDRMPNRRVKFSRREIYRRDNYKCQYCGHLVGAEGSIDHIIPSSQGGPTTWTNCVLACTTCNRKKDNRTPKQAHMKLLSTPMKPKFSYKTDRKFIPKSWEHFISEAYWEVELQNDN
jgi:5-methylcytosine-specific restriction endonuclease McrA